MFNNLHPENFTAQYLNSTRLTTDISANVGYFAKGYKGNLVVALQALVAASTLSNAEFFSALQACADGFQGIKSLHDVGVELGDIASHGLQTARKDSDLSLLRLGSAISSTTVANTLSEAASAISASASASG